MKAVQEIREEFLGYFQEKKHHILESASLFPAYDSTLLFTTAGMVPFKAYFAGTSQPSANRVATIQKCIRTTDLAEVGKTKRHLSFFEMLGNFSFGDYFKKEAIEFAWEYSTEFLKFPKENIWITIYLDDDEAFSLWRDHIGVAKEKIHRLSKKDNFWGPAGTIGVCGPCSELYLDRGEEYDPEGTCKKPGDDGERFMEFWNIVFNQFYKYESGEYAPLQKVGIDTGAGLERMASLVQGVDNVFETDELSLLCQEIVILYNVTTRDTREAQTAIHILSDHIRALCFAIGDGVFPSNESRGYVLRRMLRRAMLYGMKLDKDQNLLHRGVKKVVEIYEKMYPNLRKQEKNIRDYIYNEGNRFMSTLSMGSEKLNKIIEVSQKTKLIQGKDAFLLYDTYGFPLEMTVEIAEEKSLQVDILGFEEEMEKQRQKGRLAWKGDAHILPLENLPPTEFVGYEIIQEKTTILCLLYDKKKVGRLQENMINPKTSFYLITERSPFYPEGGGQLGDQGHITGDNFTAIVTDTQKSDELILHICEKLEGEICEGSEIQMKIDQQRRAFLRKNHSATHLLNATLKNVLGDHIRQTGSLVHSDYLRFDFSHPKKLSLSEIETIESDINNIIVKSYPVSTSVLPKKDAEKKGAVMTFGEKYGQIVRIVEIGNHSMEFCGGTHVNDTSEVEYFFIVKESSPGAGNRRIEAVSSKKALMLLENYLLSNDSRLSEIEEEIKEQDEFVDLYDKLKKQISRHKKEFNISSKKNYTEFMTILWQEIRSIKPQVEELMIMLKKKIKKERSQSDTLSPQEIEEIFASTHILANNITCYTFLKEGWDIASLKKASDSLREKQAEGVYILHSFANSLGDVKKWNLVLATSRSFAEKNKIDLGRAIKSTLKETITLQGGGGGGKEMAQANGKISTFVEIEPFCDRLNKAIKKNIVLTTTDSKKN